MTVPEVLEDTCRCTGQQSHLARYAIQHGAVLTGGYCSTHPGYLMDIRSKTAKRWGHEAVKPDGTHTICSDGVLYGMPKENK